MRILFPALGPMLALILIAGCAASPSGTPLSLPDAAGALTWGDGAYGVVLVPDAGHDAGSWDTEARDFADDGMTVVAIATPSEAAAVAALRYLLDDRGLERAALVGAGAGATVAMAVAIDQPELVDQLIVLSATGDVSRLGELPKLFVASSGEAAATDAARMAGEATGLWNELYLAEGSATGQAILEGEGREGTMAAILRRLDERR
jgi:pimeloyl-ACP methyl ester carboxylesterase